MIKFINIAEIVIAISLTASILIQNRGAGLSSTFGGDFGGYHSKRGFEKFIVFFSSILAILFIILAIVSLILSN
ncbi:MAG: preprotein translocase subunit SecG [Parcubacteria group bacterium]|jgi:protein translocase SecG subunit